ncbi:MAG: hypothetical protein CMJ85_06260 [Planctomycetes bacterium]|nr:hypothetical protein [Planctomycetota bacterium]
MQRITGYMRRHFDMSSPVIIPFHARAAWLARSRLDLPNGVHDHESLENASGITDVEARIRRFVNEDAVAARSQWILALATGIRERSTDFRYGTFAGQRLPLPPLPEQAAIVRYLDHVGRRVRRLVRAKRKLIALLTEQKQAIIHRAVTRGLDPDVPLKDSGVEWLGMVPEHWEVRRLKTLLAVPVTDGPHSTPDFLSEGIPFLSVDGIQNGELVFENCRYVSPKDHAEFKRKTAPRRGDILLGKAASTGKIARVKVDFEFSIWSPLALIPDPVRCRSQR